MNKNSCHIMEEGWLKVKIISVKKPSYALKNKTFYTKVNKKIS
jgi:hypothetical protein